MCKRVNVTKIINMERHAQHILLFFFTDNDFLAFEFKNRYHVVFLLKLIDEYILAPSFFFAQKPATMQPKYVYSK